MKILPFKKSLKIYMQNDLKIKRISFIRKKIIEEMQFFNKKNF